MMMVVVVMVSVGMVVMVSVVRGLIIDKCWACEEGHDMKSPLFQVLLSTHKEGRAYKESMRGIRRLRWGGPWSLVSSLVTIPDREHKNKYSSI